MAADMGMVSTHAQRIVRATPHLTVLEPLVVPTPVIDEQITCVVLTGMPATEAPMMVAALAVFAANP